MQSNNKIYDCALLVGLCANIKPVTSSSFRNQCSAMLLDFAICDFEIDFHSCSLLGVLLIIIVCNAINRQVYFICFIIVWSQRQMRSNEIQIQRKAVSNWKQSREWLALTKKKEKKMRTIVNCCQHIWAFHSGPLCIVYDPDTICQLEWQRCRLLAIRWIYVVTLVELSYYNLIKIS